MAERPFNDEEKLVGSIVAEVGRELERRIAAALPADRTFKISVVTICFLPERTLHFNSFASRAGFREAMARLVNKWRADKRKLN